MFIFIRLQRNKLFSKKPNIYNHLLKQKYLLWQFFSSLYLPIFVPSPRSPLILFRLNPYPHVDKLNNQQDFKQDLKQAYHIRDFKVRCTIGTLSLD